MFRLARTVHAWAGAAIALLLLILSVSGTLLVLKQDYLRSVLPEAREAPDLSPEALSAAATAADALFGRDAVRAVVFAQEGFGLHRVYLADGGGAYLSSDGALVTRWERNGRPEEWLFDLHHHLLAGETGELIAGVVAIATVLLVLGGLVAYWPMRRGWRRGFQAKGVERRELRSLHRNSGVVAALPTLILAVTGAALSFPGATRTLLGGGGASPTERVDVNATLDSDPIAAALRVAPPSQPRMIVPSRDGGPTVIRLKQLAEWHPNGRTMVRIDPTGTDMIAIIDAQALPPGERVYNAAYPVHAAKVGGPFVKVLALLGGVGLTLSCGVGLVSFLRRSWRGPPEPAALHPAALHPVDERA